MNLQIGAIYLWSYVYNMVRISSTSDKDSRESSELDREGFKEPLLSSTKLGEPGDSSDPYALPLSVSEEKAKVAVPEHGLGITRYLEMLFRKLNLKALLAPSTNGAVLLSLRFKPCDVLHFFGCSIHFTLFFS